MTLSAATLTALYRHEGVAERRALTNKGSTCHWRAYGDIELELLFCQWSSCDYRLATGSTVFHQVQRRNGAKRDKDVADVQSGDYVVGPVVLNQGASRAPGRSEDGGGDVVVEQGVSAR
jgi:hypothetical protein